MMLTKTITRRDAVAVALVIATIEIAGATHVLARNQPAAQMPPTPAASADVVVLRARLHLLRVENAQLRSALASAQTEIATQELTTERATLERELRQAFGCAADGAVDWNVVAAAGPGGTALPCAPVAPKKD